MVIQKLPAPGDIFKFMPQFVHLEYSDFQWHWIEDTSWINNMFAWDQNGNEYVDCLRPAQQGWQMF